MNFKNQNILVVGGSSGIGKEAAIQFSLSQANVIIAGRDIEKLQELQKQIQKEFKINISYIQADIRNMKSIRNLKKTLIDKNIVLDALIITAGIGKFGFIEETTEEDYDLVMNTNVKGSYFTVSILKELIKSGGSITLTSSFLIQLNLPLTSVLTASKAAIESYTKIFAKELSISDIRVNAISPGSIKSNFMKTANPSQKQIDALQKVIPKIPLQKRGNPTEIVNSILFLSSTHASYITGAIVNVDGGLSIA